MRGNSRRHAIDAPVLGVGDVWEMDRKKPSTLTKLLVVAVFILVIALLGYNASGGSVMAAKAFVIYMLAVVAIVLAREGIKDWFKVRDEAERKRIEDLELERAKELGFDVIDKMTGKEFEKIVAKVLEYQGFVTRITRHSGDFGVDIIAERVDRGRFAIQVKRQTSPVSRRAISDAVAGKFHYSCDKAAVVTSNYFTESAKSLANSTGCRLVDRDRLATWLDSFQGKPESVCVEDSNSGALISYMQCRSNPVKMASFTD